MTVQAPVFHRPFPRWAVPAAAAAVLVATGVALRPDFSLIAAESVAVKLHLATAVFAFGLGGLLLWGRKGRTAHRVGGWIWVVLMLTTATASLFITGINGDAWSWIHVLSGLTLLMAPLGLVMARRHNVKRHKQIMTGLYIGAMLVAGGFTFLPGRLMWQTFFG